MRKLSYQVEFLSDIVLPATSNTEGNIESLDFIAGSNFLGMVAKEYNKFEDSFNIFHSAKVRFGDAHILKEGKETYKMPLSYFFDKGKEERLHNHHLIEDFTLFDQLKQKRNGYITKDLETIFIDYNYTQKSAYDKTSRRSLDGSMFGYSAMKKGLKWQFSIKVDESISANDLALLEKTIIGQKRLGKSKSAQYGSIFIKKIETEQTPIEDLNAKNTVLYVHSRLALVDEQGNPSYDLKYIAQGVEIDYSKCQIKTSTFTPYNGAMQTKTYERICINKGSVIVLKSTTDEQTDEQLKEIVKGVGAYLSEGFGEVLINPSFLSQYSFVFDKNCDKEEIKPKEIKNHLSKFVKQREDVKEQKLSILNEVDTFILENKSLYKNIKSSQWGKIRSICTSGDNNFKGEIKEYISHGVKAWEDKQIKRLLKDGNSLEFIKLISIQMPKQKGADNEN